MTDQHHYAASAEPIDPPVSVSRLFHTLRAYLPAILLSVAAVMIAYLLIAIAAYLLAPKQHVTRQSFRLDFEGADEGRYPNGTRFSSAEVVSTPVLLEVYRANELSRFTSFKAFTESVFVLESNAAFETLAAAYQARLADPKLTPVDRERIQREFEDKRASLAKNEYTLHLMRNEGTARIPDVVARKSLSDILTTWARKSVNEQHVLARVAVLTPKIIDETPVERTDLLVAIHVLRSKIERVRENIVSIASLPSAQLVRTSEPDGYSLGEIAMRLEDLVRFRLEPLMNEAAGALQNPAAATRFLEAQLAYDKRALAAQQERAAAARDALQVYLAGDTPAFDAPPSANATAPRESSSGALAPQLDASFLDRLVALASDSRDREYRQSLVNAYREATLQTIPLEQSVAADEASLAVLRTGARSADPAGVRQQINGIRAEVRQLVADTNKIHAAVAELVNPSTQLYTSLGTPISRIERSLAARTLAVGAMIVLLASLSIAVIASLLHARMRQEEAAEQEEAPVAHRVHGAESAA